MVQTLLNLDNLPSRMMPLTPCHRHLSLAPPGALTMLFALTTGMMITSFPTPKSKQRKLEERKPARRRVYFSSRVYAPGEAIQTGARLKPLVIAPATIDQHIRSILLAHLRFKRLNNHPAVRSSSESPIKTVPRGLAPLSVSNGIP